MNCAEAEVEVVSGEPSAEAAKHLAACPHCQALQSETNALLTAVALPEVPVLFEAMNAQLLSEVRLGTLRRSAMSQWLGYAVAAGIGALVSAAAFSWTKPTQAPLQNPPAIVASTHGDLHLSDSEVFEEVSWPNDSDSETETEGDSP